MNQFVAALTMFALLLRPQAQAKDKETDKEKTISYYLPKTSVIVEMDVIEKRATPGPFQDFAKLFFPLAEEVSDQAPTGLSQVIVKQAATYSINKNISINTIGSPDIEQRVQVKSRGSFKDITSGMVLDEFGNTTDFKYSVRDRKWDFIFKLLIGGAKIAGTFLNPTAAAMNAFSASSNALREVPDAQRVLIETIKNFRACEFAEQDMNESDRRYYVGELLRPLLVPAFCAVPADFRYLVKKINDTEGVGHDAFVQHFQAEICAASPGITGVDCKSSTLTTFRSDTGRRRLGRFFQAWGYVRELQLIQNSTEELLGRTSGLIPENSDGLRFLVSEQQKRIQYLGEQFFGSITTSVYWHPTFRIDFSKDEVIKQSVPLFAFNKESDQPVAMLPADDLKTGARTAIARSLTPWPKVSTNLRGYETFGIMFNEQPGTGSSGPCTSSLNELRFRVPVLYNLTAKLGDTEVQRQDTMMSQGGRCDAMAVGGNSTVSFEMNAKTGALKSINLDTTSVATPETADQLLGLTTAILGAKISADAANLAAPPPTAIQQLEQQLRQRLLEACLESPLTSECAQYLNRK